MIERVIYPFRGAELGGSHVATFTLAAALQSAAAVECVIVAPDGTLIQEEARRSGLSAIASGEAPTGRNNLATDYLWARQRARLLKSIADGAEAIVHCNDINTLRSWGFAGRLAGLGVVYHHHALNRMWWPPHLASLLHANAIICVSDSTLEAIRGWRGDAVKLLNPFRLNAEHDRAGARQALLEEFGWPPETRIVGWVGNFWERKRPLFFLETAAQLAKRDPRCRFVMYGRDGDWSAGALREKARELGIGEAVALPGFRQPVEANLASLDLLMAPAPNEPFGRALVEAIILGTPIVATSGAGHSEIIDAWGGGQLVRQEATPDEMAIVCATMLDNAQQFTLPKPDRFAIAAQLDPVAYASRILDIYDRAARRRRAARARKPTPADNRSNGSPRGDPAGAKATTDM